VEFCAADGPMTLAPPCDVIFLTIPEEVRAEWNRKATEKKEKKKAKNAVDKNKKPAQTET
jgi:hypothetical protein